SPVAIYYNVVALLNGVEYTRDSCNARLAQFASEYREMARPSTGFAYEGFSPREDREEFGRCLTRDQDLVAVKNAELGGCEEQSCRAARDPGRCGTAVQQLSAFGRGNGVCVHRRLDSCLRLQANGLSG